MKLLLDTCIWGGAVPELRAGGHDVVWAGDWQQDPGDDEILAIAHREQRVLVTLDKDFGELAIVHERPHGGILRIVGFPARKHAATCQQALDVHGDHLVTGAIVTMFMRQHSGFWHTYSSTRRNFLLDYSWYVMPEETKWRPRATLFIELDKSTDGIKVGYHPIAVHLASTSAFDELKNQGFIFETKYAPNAPHIGSISDEFKFSLPTIDAWKQHRDELTALTRKVCAAYDSAREETSAGE